MLYIVEKVEAGSRKAIFKASFEVTFEFIFEIIFEVVLRPF